VPVVKTMKADVLDPQLWRGVEPVGYQATFPEIDMAKDAAYASKSNTAPW
jgi:hypothetical protein